MSGSTSKTPMLDRFRIHDSIFLLGTFEPRGTIYRQQVRALNLVHATVEEDPQCIEGPVAIIGGGFGGLTLAAALLKKGVKDLTVFEKRDALCALQQGSDSRWVHPHIY